jgi:aryl-alcohol dehydrogenase-like predicted oxidoreductase
MKLQRREFLHRTALGLGGLVVGTPRPTQAGAAPAYFDPFALVPLGKTPLKVTRIALGTGTHGGGRQSDHSRMGKEKLEALIRESFDRGTRLFDLADQYGTHPYVIPALKGIPRDRYQIVTKYSSFGSRGGQQEDADVAVARFLRELQTDYIDLVLLHVMTSPTWPDQMRKQMDMLSKLKDRGTIRALGCSCHSVGALEAAAREPWCESVHARINPYGILMDAAPEKVVPILQRIHAAGKGVVGMKIVGEGQLRNDTDKFDASVKFALTLGCVDVLDVGCQSPAEVDDLAARVRRVERPRA